MLGSARCPEFAEPAGRAQGARATSRARGIDALVVIGGNGSQTGSASLAREGFPVVGVASTIDNDLYGNDVSIGCDTAINITLEAIDRLRTTASSHQRAFAVETMGRDCGYIALMSGIAGGAEVIALPEQRNHARGGGRAPARRLPARQDARARGDRRGREVRRARADAVLRARSASRSASTCASRASATWCAAASRAPPTACSPRAWAPPRWTRLARGKHGVLVGILSGEIAATPLAEIAGRTRPADAELLELARVMAM